jgi:hypothetical protein
LFNRDLTLSTAVIDKDAMALRLCGGVAPFLLEKTYEMEDISQAVILCGNADDAFLLT